MRLFIAEKPSLARAIADVLPKPHRKGDGFIECGNGQVVTWCIGHLLEQAQPDVYDSRYARWNLNDLHRAGKMAPAAPSFGYQTAQRDQALPA